MSNDLSKLDYANEVADSFLSIGDSCIMRDDFEAAARWNCVAANVLAKQNRHLSDARIERNMQRLAHFLLEVTPIPVSVDHPSEASQVCLHVLNEALPHGGHTAMAVRWIRNDQSAKAHSVALLGQKAPVPNELRQAVEQSGGHIYAADSFDSFLGRAGWLRTLARRYASPVILHIDVDDVIAGIAFGICGGPPVLLVNHAAHVFWTGASIADLVVNCRGSQLEQFWTHSYRGASKCATVPIPLEMPCHDRAQTFSNDRKLSAKRHLGISTSSILIITCGASYKYKPVDCLNFLSTCEAILGKAPEACIVALGPEEDLSWKEAREKSGSRLRTVGRCSRAEIATWQQAADLYIEGFPFGSTTALLESGILGLPVVLAPAECPPPFASDGVALDNVLTRPGTLKDYIQTVVRLTQSSEHRLLLAKKLSASIREHHTGARWNRYVNTAMSQLPTSHSVMAPQAPVQTPRMIHEYWDMLQNRLGWSRDAIVAGAVFHAFAIGLRPTVKPLQQSRAQGKDREHARLLSAIADQYFWLGEFRLSKEFYLASLQSCWIPTVQWKNLLLSFGSLGVNLRKGLTSFLRDKQLPISSR